MGGKVFKTNKNKIAKLEMKIAQLAIKCQTLGIKPDDFYKDFDPVDLTDNPSDVPEQEHVKRELKRRVAHFTRLRDYGLSLR